MLANGSSPSSRPAKTMGSLRPLPWPPKPVQPGWPARTIPPRSMPTWTKRQDPAPLGHRTRLACGSSGCRACWWSRHFFGELRTDHAVLLLLAPLLAWLPELPRCRQMPVGPRPVAPGPRRRGLLRRPRRRRATVAEGGDRSACGPGPRLALATRSRYGRTPSIPISAGSLSDGTRSRARISTSMPAGFSRRVNHVEGPKAAERFLKSNAAPPRLTTGRARTPRTRIRVRNQDRL